MSAASLLTPTGYRESFSGFTPEKAPSGLQWFHGLRQKAYERFRSLGFPTRNMEPWKYVPLGSVLEGAFAPPRKVSPEKIEAAELERYFFSSPDENRLVFVNGTFCRELSSVSGLPKGVVYQPLSQALASSPESVRPYLGFSLADETNPFAVINAFCFRDGVFLFVPDETPVSSVFHVLWAGAGEESPIVFYPRILVVAGTRACARVVVTHAALPGADFFRSAVSEVYAGSGSKLEYLERGHGGQTKALSFAVTRFYLKEESALNRFLFGEGGVLNRNETSVEFGGENASAFFKGFEVLKGRSQSFTHAGVCHRVPHCVSRQFYKGVLGGESKSEFNSLVAVDKGAFGSDSNQLSRHLLLSDSAEGYARPQLRIDTDDVSCIHGAAVGKLEKDELFYLRSRGLSKEEARWVLTCAFAEEALEGLEPVEFRERLRGWVRGELKGMIRC
ncbi:MAG: SufD family Fe-S cluster assembly protein [Candidatus Omnitrophica bacterium]|nr:SufD family Fe-S cluster assembly protein [Candidatus Omnitrophota bacterium]